MIHVLAKIQLASGKRDEFLAEFHQLVPLVQAESGCVEYGPTVDATTDIAAQKSVGADTVMVIEKWESLDALKSHLQAEHMLGYRQRVRDLVQATTLHILTSA